MRNAVDRALDEGVQRPKKLDPKDKVVQIMEDARYDVYAVLSSGRVFRKRARGQSGSYDLWKEIDVIGAIGEDLLTNNSVDPYGKD